MDLLTTTDGYRYFNTNRDYADYIREKCGDDVANYVESNLNEYHNILFNESMLDAYEGITYYKNKLAEIDSKGNNPLLRLRVLHQMQQELLVLLGDTLSPIVLNI